MPVLTKTIGSNDPCQFLDQEVVPQLIYTVVLETFTTWLPDLTMNLAGLKDLSLRWISRNQLAFGTSRCVHYCILLSFILRTQSGVDNEQNKSCMHSNNIVVESLSLFNPTTDCLVTTSEKLTLVLPFALEEVLASNSSTNWHEWREKGLYKWRNDCHIILDWAQTFKYLGLRVHQA